MFRYHYRDLIEVSMSGFRTAWYGDSDAKRPSRGPRSGRVNLFPELMTTALVFVLSNGLMVLSAYQNPIVCPEKREYLRYVGARHPEYLQRPIALKSES